MSKRTAELLPTGKVQENGGAKPERPRYVVTGARVTVDIGTLADGFVSCPMNVTAEVGLIDEHGKPLPRIDLNGALHDAVDAAIARLEQLRREGA